MNLYEIDNAIINCVDEETGEIVDIEKLECLQMERDAKIENISCWIKNLKSDSEQLKQEADKLLERKRVADNRADSLKKYLKDYLNGEKFKTAKCSISYRKTESVDITDATAIPEEFLKHYEPVPMKTDIKNAINAGRSVPGAEIVVNQSIIIK